MTHAGTGKEKPYRLQGEERKYNVPDFMYYTLFR